MSEHAPRHCPRCGWRGCLTEVETGHAGTGRYCPHCWSHRRAVMTVASDARGTPEIRWWPWDRAVNLGARVLQNKELRN